MKWKRSGVLTYAIPLCVILVLIVLLTLTLIRLAGVQRVVRNNVNANMVWVIYQAHIESLKLAKTVQRGQIDTDINDDLLHRYQMWLSRIQVLEDGPQSRALHNLGMAELLNEQSQAIASLGADMETNEQLLGVLGQFGAQLHRAAGKAMMAQWEEEGRRIDTYRNTVLTVIFLMIGIWAGSIFISVQLLLTLKRVRDNERVRQRGIELQKQLENERKISDLYRSFGSMVSHQFRTPLAIIDATMQRLLRASDRMSIEEIRHRAKKAREATQRLTHLIETILHADRYMDQLEALRQASSLAALASQAVAEMNQLLPHRQILFQSSSPESVTAYCDPVLTVQIISNLLSNAVKYSNDDKPVSVRVYKEDNWVCCAVQDQGPGISATDMPHIFKRYFRAWTATDVVGTGIGLHIAMELALLQAGDVLAHSEQGHGSTFVLRLPFFTDSMLLLEQGSDAQEVI